MNMAAAGWFETLLRASWQGAMALGLVWMISRWIVAVPGRFKAWLWRLAFLKLLVALLWVTPISLAVLPAKPVSIASSLPPIANLPNLPNITESLSPTGPMPEIHVLLDWRAWLLIAWIAGVLWGLARVVRHWRAARALQQDSTELRDDISQDILRRLAAPFRLRRVPPLRHCESITSPILLGLLRPSIILPSRVLHRFDTSQIEMILAHELAHVRRRDLWWLWLFTICEVLFFFHPLVWLVWREWNLATESACDELALRLTRRAQHEYGSMLVDVVAQISTPHRSARVLAVGMFETANSIKRRLKGMQIRKNPLTLTLIIILMVVGTLTLIPYRLVAQAPDAETLSRLKEENAKLKQELDATRQEIEALRLQAMSIRERSEEARRADMRERLKAQGQREALARLDSVERELSELRNRYTDNHPDVIAKRLELKRAEQDIEKMIREQPGIHADVFNPRGRTKETFIPANPDQRSASKEERELLSEEIKLAERQVRSVNRMLENGKSTFEELLRVQRELLDLKLQLAQLEGSKAEQRAVLLQQRKIAEQLMKEQRKRVEVGVIDADGALSSEREVLRIKRALAALE
jgi:beta-lactamase regulating signal transducer with metallopeptidase domain